MAMTLQNELAIVKGKISEQESLITQYAASQHPKTKLQLIISKDEAFTQLQTQLTQLRTQLTQLQEKELILLRQLQLPQQGNLITSIHPSQLLNISFLRTTKFFLF